MSEIELTIDLLFTKCDGILNGMGTSSGIPPVFIGFYYHHFKLNTLYRMLVTIVTKRS